ncbi:hypothetical protein WJX79_001837 [Trebouxia sp. C0005]
MRTQSRHAACGILAKFMYMDGHVAHLPLRPTRPLIAVLLVAHFSSAWGVPLLDTQIIPQRPADHSAYLDPPPGFPKTVGKAQSNSPDDVLASNFGRKLHVEDAPSGSAAGLPASSSVGNLSRMGDGAIEEHPSRILFVRGLDATVSDEALVHMFEAYGEIRSLYTACKPRGFVVLSFYDLRASCLAIHALQGARVGTGNLHISFSTPKDNMGDKDAHQGTVTVFNVAGNSYPIPAG